MGAIRRKFMATQAQMTAHHDLEVKIGGERELRGEDLEKVAGGTTPFATALMAAYTTVVVSATVTDAAGW
jgi:ABC-type uncharacterized transport system substrate-binding protein